MFCVKCGNELHDGDLFCAKCGNEVKVADGNFSSKIRNAKVFKDYFGFNSDDNIAVKFDDIDTIEFGEYPQNDITGKTTEKISWFILDKDLSNNKALLISKYGLDIYQEESDTYRYWNYFKDDYFKEFVSSLLFTEEEKTCIIESDIINEPIKINNKEYEMKGGNTKEKVFILNYKEAIKYMYVHEPFSDSTLKTNEDWINKGTRPDIHAANKWKLTKFAQNKVNEQVNYHLIRNYLVSDYGNKMIVVDGNGCVWDFDGNDMIVGIRPAMWVKI